MQYKLQADTYVAGINDSSDDKVLWKSWINLWKDTCGLTGADTSSIPCFAASIHGGCSGQMVGAHVWLYGGRGRVNTDRAYIVPLCNTHNGRDNWNFPKWFKLPAGTPLMGMVPHECYWEPSSTPS